MYHATTAFHRWAGHAARMDGHPAQWMTAHRSALWESGMRACMQSLDVHNYTKWKRPQPGRPVRWEDSLLAFYGPEWQLRALDRDTWKHAESNFVMNRWHALRPRTASADLPALPAPIPAEMAA